MSCWLHGAERSNVKHFHYHNLPPRADAGAGVAPKLRVSMGLSMVRSSKQTSVGTWRCWRHGSMCHPSRQEILLLFFDDIFDSALLPFLFCLLRNKFRPIFLSLHSLRSFQLQSGHCSSLLFDICRSFRLLGFALIFPIKESRLLQEESFFTYIYPNHLALEVPHGQAIRLSLFFFIESQLDP